MNFQPPEEDDPRDDAERIQAGERSIIATYDKLHKAKLGAHWLWCVIEQIAAGIPEDEAMRGYGYYAPARQDQQGQAPEGWKLVPVDPTPAMVYALWQHRDALRGQSENRIARGSYAAMLAAAPSLPVGKEPTP